MQHKRTCYWIQPEFQIRMIRQWAILVFMAITATQAVTMTLIWYQDRQLPGQLLYVSEKVEAGPMIVDPVKIHRAELFLPAMALSLSLGFFMTLIAGVVFSHRLAGPIYRIRQTIKDYKDGKSVKPIVLRKNDEFKDLAEDLNQIFARRR